jgi:hypothetical protein
MKVDGIELDLDDSLALADWLRGNTKKGSARDLQARRVLARMLRSSEPLEMVVRLILADAVDPDGVGGLQLSLKRKLGRRRQINHLDVAAYVYKRKKAGVKAESAINEAMTKFNVGRSTVTGAWSKWRPYFERGPKLFERIQSKKHADLLDRFFLDITD